MLCLDGLQNFFEAVRRIEDYVAAGAGKAADLSGGFGHFMRGDGMSGSFDGPDRSQNVSRNKRGNGFVADMLVEQINEPLLFLDIGGRVYVFFGFKPFLRDHREGQGLFLGHGLGFRLDRLFVCSRVNILGQKFFGVIPLTAGVFQRNSRVCAETQSLSFSGKTVVHPPELAACW